MVEKQALFARLLGKLIDEATKQGWGFTLGEGFRSDRQKRTSDLTVQGLAELNIASNGEDRDARAHDPSSVGPHSNDPAIQREINRLEGPEKRQG